MTLTELLADLYKRNVRLRTEKGELFCDGPREALPPDLQTALIERKTEIIAFLNHRAASQGMGLHKAPRESDLPLSFAQQRLWFIDQLEPGTPLYNISRAFRLRGPLKVDALHRALNEIVRRHEVLRTTFSNSKGLPLQVISPSLTIALPLAHLDGIPESEREQESLRLANEEAQRPFDLARGPLLRAALFGLAPHDHVLLLTMHHIVSDGWSLGVLYRELSVLYDAFANGQSSPLPELPLQYVDFAHWQKQWLQGKVLERQLSYWGRQLEGHTVLQLPTDRPRPAVQSFKGATRSAVLSRELSNAVNQLSRRTRGTLFMTLLAAFKILLHRYSGQEDILVSTPIAGRNRVEIEGLIGFFVNTLVLRSDLSGNCRFGELLQQVRNTALEAYAHQDLPFDKLVEELQPERNLSHAPLAQVMFVFQNYPNLPLQMSGLTATLLQLSNSTAKFDLTLQIKDEPRGLECLFEYNTALFDDATVTRMLDHFQVLTEGIVADPDRRLSELPILPANEKHQILVQWSRTENDVPAGACIHEMFETQVERTPDAVAVVFEDRQLTYRDLNARANQLAHYLRKLACKPGIAVGVCMERSLETIVAILGILKTGGTYLPLDAAYPKERLAFMLEDTRAPVVLTQSKLLSQLPERAANAGTMPDLEGPEAGDGGPISAVCLDRDWEKIALEGDENLENIADWQDLAYVIYTSGSTGNPKGVMISQESIAGHCVAARSYYELDETDRVLEFASMSFDASLEQILPTLIAGARLVLRDELAAPEALHKKIYDSELTVINLPTAYWHQAVGTAVAAPESPAGGSLRLAIIGGEEMPLEAVKVWQQSPYGGVRLLNAYGPTEATITATVFDISPAFSSNPPSRTVPIGRPLGDRELFILDPCGNPVPVGVPGELHIGGASLALGYLNRPDLTSEKFIPNPFSDQAGARLYKTGDFARHLPDGNIEFLGRIDNQVKIRGFRIEPGEVESSLGQHPAVREAVVIVREDVPGEKRLVGYLVTGQSHAPAIGELRSFLTSRLPKYMIPSAFVLLDSLPVTSSGKVDRRALPAPGQSRPEVGSFVGPRVPVEEALVKIWREVLSLDQVGIHDNFFELGGHSLLATQVVSRAREAFDVELSLRALFENPTVAGLSAVIAKIREETTRKTGSVITPLPREAYRTPVKL